MTDAQTLPGQRLKEERIRQNLTEQEAAAKLHLSTTYLKALEADDYRRLPEATFVKGYVRNYARLLGLPAEELAAQYHALVKDERESTLRTPIHVIPHQRRNLWLWPVLILVLAVVSALAWWATRPSPPDNLEPDLPAATVTVPDNSAPETPAEIELPPLDADPEAVDSALSEPPTPPATPDPVIPEIDRMTMSFADACWVDVLDADGKRLFQGEQTAGSQIEVTGEAPFRVTLGNAAAVSAIELNGDPQTLPRSVRGRVIRINVP